MTAEKLDAAAGMKAFVIGPIGDEDAPTDSTRRIDFEKAMQVFDLVIKPACAAHDISVVRADEITRVGEINEQIYRLLRDSPLVIADLTGGNPNVMYELGLRHSTGKLTIPIGEKGALPFDVSSIRTILFERNHTGLAKARTRLITAIGTALTEGADPVAATRVWLEDSVGSTESIVAATESADASDASVNSSTESQTALLVSDEDEPGFLEKIAELEEAMPSLLQGLNLATSIMAEIAGAFEVGSKEARSAHTASDKVRVANRVAQKLGVLAPRLSVAAAGVTTDVDRFERGFETLINLLPNGDGAARREFEGAIATLSAAALESIPSAEGFRDHLLSSDYATAQTRNVYRRIAQSLGSFIDASSRVARWKDMLGTPR